MDRERSREKPAQMPFRAPPALMQLLRECADRHARSVAEELRVAVELHVTRSLVEALPTADARRKLGAQAVEREREMRARLAQLLDHAYRPGRPAGLLDSLVWVNERLPK